MNTLLILAATTLPFNLVCTGLISESATRFRSKPIRSEYRLDLNQGIFCRDDCDQIQQIFSVTDLTITLENVRWGEGPSTVVQTVINRESGEYNRLFRSGVGGFVEVGTCERAPFTGFPERKVERKF